MSHDHQRFAEPLTPALLQRRQMEIHDRHRRTVTKVEQLLDTQKRVGAELSSGLTVLQDQRVELDTLEKRDADNSLLASLVRPFLGRRNALARKSIAEGLIVRYEQVSVRLREATAFADELKLCALELQAEVDQLHRDLQVALQHQQRSAERVLELEHARTQVAEDASTTQEQKDRLHDRYTFDLRSESVSLALYGAAVELCRQHLPPARALRDTVLRLHEEMSNYVLAATHNVNAAGRRISALGMLADAPIVVAELQQSLEALGTAMEATSQWIDRSHRFIAEVLPELDARIRLQGEVASKALLVELSEHDRVRTRKEAEIALRRAAEAEIASLLGEDER
jgi:hypothetical protein